MWTKESLNAALGNAAGDKQGLRRVYEAYARYIYTIVYGILSNKENAEDVTSEFYKAVEKADYYKPGADIRVI